MVYLRRHVCEPRKVRFLWWSRPASATRCLRQHPRILIIVVTNIEFQWEINDALVIGQEALYTFNSTGEYTVKLKAISTSSGSTKHETEDTSRGLTRC